MRTEYPEEVFELRQQILEYLLENPQSADSLAGIYQWWLARVDDKCKPPLISSTLD